MDDRRFEKLLLILLAVAAFLAALSPVWDPDSFWHLAFGRFIFETGSLPHNEPFAFTREGMPLTDLSWLPHLIFFAAYKAFGFPGTEILVSLAAASTLLVMTAAARTAGTKIFSLAVYFSLFFNAFTARFKLRPEALSLLCFAVLVSLLIKYRKDKDSPRWSFFLLFLAWTQVHPSWIYGAVLIPVFVLERHWNIFRTGFGRDLIWMGALPAAALFLNPYGYKPVLFPFSSFITMKAAGESEISEWRGSPFTFSTAPFLLLAFAVCVYALARLLKKKDTALPFIVSLIQFLFLVSWVRYSSFAFIALAPFACVMFGEALEKLRVSRKLIRSAAVILLLLPVLSVVNYTPTRLIIELNYPEKETAFLLSKGIGGNILHTYVAGGFIEFRTYPENKSYADGRYFDFLPQIREYEDAKMDIKRFRDFSLHHLFDIAVIPYSKAVVSTPGTGLKRNAQALMLPRESWAPVFYGPYGTVFLKRNAANAAHIDQFEFKVLFPYDKGFSRREVHSGRADRKSLESELKRAAETGAGFLAE
ncbi:MAG TPA: hypothetical protein PLA03_11345 [Acidobacteriota bacterium]|nr:hypothetical protein [Acidobacteriota bacterium]